MSNLKIERLTTYRAPKVAPLYALCFGEGKTPEEGWGERAACWAKQCLDDGRGKIIPYTDVGMPCPDCHVPMMEAYPLEWTTSYINKELSYPGTVALLGLINGVVAAAAWGYENDIQFIASKKYPNNKIMIDKVVTSYQKMWPQQPKTLFISEVFVAPQYRKNDYAQELVNKLVKGSKYPVTSRTLDTSPMTTVFAKAGLNQILAAGSDQSNSQRVFYASSNI